MLAIITRLVRSGLDKQVPATGLGLFRIGFGLVALQEILFLLYFNHLIFDDVPFLEKASPILPFFLYAWGLAVVHLIIGRFTRYAAIANYAFWILFLVFTPMWQAFDGGFDLLMISSSFLLIFLPSERSLSIDNLRLKLRYSDLQHRYQPRQQVPVLAYTLPVFLSMGLLYLDSAVHKLFAEHWRNGTGGWLPSSMPYYISALDVGWLLNIQGFQQLFGYAIMVFQFVFIFIFWHRCARIPLWVTGVVFHLGITLVFNIYPFGLAMLVHYCLLVPFAVWRCLQQRCQLKQPTLRVFYDAQCPLCLKAVLSIEHFDLFKAIEFKDLQQHALHQPELVGIPEATLLKDLYALDRDGRLYSGVDTYSQILQHMRYTAIVGYAMRLPGIYLWANRTYRRIADQRERLLCHTQCDTALAAIVSPEGEQPLYRLYNRYAKTPAQRARRISKFVTLVLLLQLNVTVHYGLLYRMDTGLKDNSVSNTLAYISNTLTAFSHTFLGITPHALYLHDHLEGYNRILALTYQDADGHEQWLPFVNEEGRIVAPNWGRVQSMWANVAVTPDINRSRLEKFTKKVTAFWGTKVGLNLNAARFTIKMKRVETPFEWQRDLRKHNLSQPWDTVGQVIWREGAARFEWSEKL